MKYQILVLDLDGTLTNSNKQITEPTRAALLEIQEQGKKVVLASGRPTQGVVPLAESLRLSAYGSYILSFNGARIIDCSEPYFLEIMPQKIDKAFSLQRLLNSIGLTSDEMICCGDGYNDVTMIESAGLGVAMQNAQPLVLEKADFITKSNDEDGVLHVINEFMRD